MATRIPNSVRSSIATAIRDAIDAGPAAGQLRIYTGTQVATADTAVAGTLLATVVLGDPSGTVATGVLTFADPAAVNAVASGTAGWFRIVDSTGATVMDGAVTATGGGGELQLATTTITSGLSIDITAFSVTMPAG